MSSNRRGRKQTNAAAAEEAKHEAMSRHPSRFGEDSRCTMSIRHEELHQALDELLACFLGHHNPGPGGTLGKVPSNTTVAELMAWSFKQTASGRTP